MTIFTTFQQIHTHIYMYIYIQYISKFGTKLYSFQILHVLYKYGVTLETEGIYIDIQGHIQGELESHIIMSK